MGTHYDLNGRRAVVTGGSSGIGLATAECLLRSGATVEIWSRNQRKMDEAMTVLSGLGPVTARSVDVCIGEEVGDSMDRFIAAHGGIDLLINNAGMAQRTAPLMDLTVEEWREQFVTNIDSIFHCSKAALPSMLHGGFGRIVNVASMAGKEGNAFQSAYAAAKAGVIGLTKSLGKELATSGITVNAVVPALFETPMALNAIGHAPEVFESIKAKIPMNRFGQVEEAGAMIAWICSDDCSFTTGFAFDLSGGRATY